MLSDPIRWPILGHLRDLALPDAWIGAGFVRNAVWDHLHDRPAAPPATDIDIIWFDPARTDPAVDASIERHLQATHPGIRWSVKNQARMHLRNADPPYPSATGAMRCWPETATAVAVRRTDNNHCEVAAPWGLDDLFGLILRPTPRFTAEKAPIFQARLRDKAWCATWPRLRIRPNACAETPGSSPVDRTAARRTAAPTRCER